MTWHDFVFLWLQSHPILAALSFLIVLYNVYDWLYPDPIMKLPMPRGGRLFGGHLRDVIEWVAWLCIKRTVVLIKVAALVVLQSSTRGVSESWVGMYEYEDFSLCVDILIGADKEVTRLYSGNTDCSR
jgi:hypothetical protein